MKYIIVDLEATCEKDNRNFVNEIIEIGAVKINSQGLIESEFNEFIKPKKNPELSEFCKKLTTINQEDIDNAEKFPTVLDKFKDWIGNDDFILCSWGFYDRKQLVQDMEEYNICSDWLKGKHISLKHQHMKYVIKKNKRPVGMGKALKTANLPLVGTHHRGIDDARNISQIFTKYFDCWNFKESK